MVRYTLESQVELEDEGKDEQETRLVRLPSG